MMEGVESTTYPEATETRMGVTSGLAIQYFAARGGGSGSSGLFGLFRLFGSFGRETKQTR
jgi:hypothetical protein